MQNANRQFVLMKEPPDSDGGLVPVIYGNRFGRPFENEVNAQRSLTRRKSGDTESVWTVMEISR